MANYSRRYHGNLFLFVGIDDHEDTGEVKHGTVESNKKRQFVNGRANILSLHRRWTTGASKKDFSFLPGNCLGSVHIGSILSYEGVGEALARKMKSDCQTVKSTMVISLHEILTCNRMCA